MIFSMIFIVDCIRVYFSYDQFCYGSEVNLFFMFPDKYARYTADGQHVTDGSL